MKKSIIWTLRSSPRLTPEFFQQFREKARAAGYGPTAAIVRLMQRYLAKGFDDGHPEQAPQGEAREADS